jgi:hypothetical protein
METRMTLGEAYCTGKLVRVTGEMTTGPRTPPKPFCCAVIIHPETGRAAFAAPLLRYLIGRHQDKLRQHFQRMGWRATVVR